MITDYHGRIEKKTVESDTVQSQQQQKKTTTTTSIGIFIVRVTMGYQFVMNVIIILLYCNRNVNRTIVFLILIYW